MSKNQQQEESSTKLIQTISNLERNFNERLDLMEKRYNEQRCEINAINSNNNGFNRSQSNSRGNNSRGRGGNYSNNVSNSYQGNRDNFNGVNSGSDVSNPYQRNRENFNTNRNNNREPIRCYKCDGQNHIARNCLSKN